MDSRSEQLHDRSKMWLCYLRQFGPSLASSAGHPVTDSALSCLSPRLCCLCGVSIAPNPTNMCANCIRSQVDITDGIQKAATILWCKECNRYLQPPRHWLRAELESRELLTFCIKRLKGLQKARLGGVL
jgi:NMD3 family